MKRTRSNRSSILPCILAMGFVPLLVHEYTYRTHLSVFDWFPDSAETQVDFFLAYKSFAIITLGAIMLLLLLADYAGKRKKPLSFTPAFYFLLAYAGLVLISALLSPYRAYAFRGNYELFESVWVVLSYLLFCYYTYHCVQTEDQAKAILNWSGIGIFIVSAIGVFQYLGHDFFQSEFGKKLITNPARWNDLSHLKFNSGAAYTTLYNVDYLSFYYGLLLPIAIVLVISTQKLLYRLLYGLFCVLFIICLIYSNASSGIMALAITAVIALYILLSRRKQWFRIGAITGGVALVAGVAVLLFTSFGHSISTRLFGNAHHEDNYTVTEFQTNENDIVLTANGTTLKLSYETDLTNGTFLLSATDADNNAIPYTVSDDGNNLITFDDSNYESYQVKPVFFDENSLGIEVKGPIGTQYFTKIGDNGYYYRNSVGKFVKFEKTPLSRLVYDDFMSGRGRLIKRIVPLLKRHILLGIGANNFLLEYPQLELLARLNGHGYDYDVKAHGWYLQQWVENGLFAILCLISFYLWYAIQSIRLYHKANLRDSSTLLGFGLFLSVTTYMLVALFNDSNVNTAPVFWILFGMGRAMNRIVTKKEQEAKP